MQDTHRHRVMTQVVDEPAVAAAPDAAAAPEQGARTTRRSFLRGAGIAGGTALVVVAGGASYRAYDQGVLEAGEGGAYDPWRDWEASQGPMALVSAAVLAANPHNSQAWTFRTTPAQIDLFADRGRSTGALDPFGRELQTGLGCALENLLQAAPANGYRTRLTLLPTPGSPVHVARVELAPGPRRRAALHGAIPKRHTDRTAYSARAVDPPVLAQMSALSGGLAGTRLHWFAQPAEREEIGRLMVDAAGAVTGDQQQSRDGFALFRSSWDDIQAFRDGLTLDTQGLSKMTTAIAKLLPAYSRGRGDEFWVDATRKTHTTTAAAYGIVAVDDAGDTAQRVLGGRLLERIHLWTAVNGLSLHHMNQMTERVDRERQLGLEPRFGPAVRALIPDGGGQALSTFRIGYPTSTDGRRPSPRRSAGEVTT